MNARRTFLLLALLLPPALAALAAEPASYLVVRTVDGDTIVIEVEGKPVKVRLIGVDTPEVVDPRKPVQRFGKEASAFTRDLLKGQRVTLKYDQQKTDRYKRVLAYVYRAKDGLFVNRHIIEQGYGFAYTKYPFDAAKMREFREAERKAREGKRGLWGEQKAEAKEVPKAAVKGEVFGTRTGKKYHAAGCRHLSKSMIGLTLEDAKRRGLTPCRVCKPAR